MQCNISTESTDDIVFFRIFEMNHLLLRRLLDPISLDGALLVVRVWLGAMMAYHGFPKVFGNAQGFVEYLNKLGFPAPELWAALAGGAEFFGGLLIVVGFLTRPAAIAVLITMLVAGFIAHGADPFSKKELALAYVALSLTTLLSGSGKFSLDALWLNTQKDVQST